MFCCGACWNAKWAQSNDGPYSCGAPFHCHYQRADAEEGLWCSIELKTELSICAQSVDVISVSGVFSPVQTLAHDTAAATKQSARDQPETNAGNLGPDWFDNTSEMSIELFSDWSLCTMHHAHDCHMPIWNQVRLMDRDRFGSFLVIIKLDLSMFFGCCHARRKRLQVFYFDRQ